MVAFCTWHSGRWQSPAMSTPTMPFRLQHPSRAWLVMLALVLQWTLAARRDPRMQPADIQQRAFNMALQSTDRQQPWQPGVGHTCTGWP